MTTEAGQGCSQRLPPASFLLTAILLSPFLWLFNVLRDPRILTSVKAMKHETFARSVVAVSALHALY